jgi:hypothetical protein
MLTPCLLQGKGAKAPFYDNSPLVLRGVPQGHLEVFKESRL